MKRVVGISLLSGFVLLAVIWEHQIQSEALDASALAPLHDELEIRGGSRNANGESIVDDASEFSADANDRADGRASDSAILNDSGQHRDFDEREAAETAAWVREDAKTEVDRDYRQLLRNLDLTQDQNMALYGFLIDDVVANTMTKYSDGTGLPPRERLSRLEGVLGSQKATEFLALEENISAFREVARLDAGLEKRGFALTAAQQDAMLDIFVDVSERVDFTMPNGMEPNTIESLRHALNQVDESERLVLELAPSVLTAEQVRYMFDRYQANSYARSQSLEQQSKRRAKDPADPPLLSYPSYSGDD